MSCEVPDRLNLGCGLDYRAGYLNLDRSPAAVADAVVSAHTLELPGAHFREILLNNLLEHLGYIGAYRLLIALHPTLRDDGELHIATPDLDRSIAQYARASSAAERENVLCHIYGTEEPGMAHLFCFPRDCLVELLGRCGYRITSIEEHEAVPMRPLLQVVARRDSEPDVVRRNALRENLLNAPALHIGYADFPYFEGLCDQAWHVASSADFDEWLHIGRATSPRLTLLLMRELRDRLTSTVGAARIADAEPQLIELAARDAFAAIAPLVDSGRLADFAAARRYLDMLQSTAPAAGAPTDPTVVAASADFACDFFTAERFGEFRQRLRAQAIRTESARPHPERPAGETP
jgi:hypothetical protein